MATRTNPLHAIYVYTDIVAHTIVHQIESHDQGDDISKRKSRAMPGHSSFFHFRCGNNINFGIMRETNQFVRSLNVVH